MAFANRISFNSFPHLILMFTCCELHKQEEIREKQEKYYMFIGEQTSDYEMAVNARAYFEVSGGILIEKTDNKKFFLT